jgi:hypothetical protein
MEKNSVDSDTEQVTPEVVETIPAVKPKRKLNLTDEQRAKRAENMKKVALARIEKSRAVNAEVADKVKAIHKEAVQKGKKIRMKKAIEIQHQNLDTDSDSDSSVELSSSKKKKKGKQPINIIVKNYGVPREQKSFDASEQIAKLKDIYREPEPVVEQPKIRLGYFV